MSEQEIKLEEPLKQAPEMTEADKDNQQRSIQLALYWLDRRGAHDAGPDFAIKTASDVLRNALVVKPGLRRAYLVAGFKLAGEPWQVPVFKGVGIFSEPEPTHDIGMRLFVVHTEDDLTFDAAHKRLLSRIRSAPELAWVIPHLKERDLR